jgi:hypothetical protein
MQIKINDQPLDFTVDRDETLGEVVRELRSWLRGSDLVLYSVKHREREFLASPPEQWENTVHSEIDELAVTVGPSRNLRSENLRTVLQYLDLLDAALSHASDEELSELTTGFPAMVESITQVAPREAALQRLSGLLADPAAQPLSVWPKERIDEARRLIERLGSLAGRRLQEIENPRVIARELAAALNECRADAVQVAVLLQTGRDREAMDVIIRFSELFQSLARVLHSLAATEGNLPSVGGKSQEEFFREMNGFLSELVEAFVAQDSVLIGDLMEYEVAPRLEELRAALEEIL